MHRSMCEVLEEMRNLVKNKHFDPLLGLIEEVQSMGNKMEARISEVHDWERHKETIKRLEGEISDLEYKRGVMEGIISLDEQIAELQKRKSDLESGERKPAKKKKSWED